MFPVRRAERRLAMATATKKARIAEHDIAGGTSEAASMQFLIFEDNGGDYGWTLLDPNGQTLARSASFASYDDAEDAARIVLAGAVSAQIEPRPGTDSPVDIVARREAVVARDDAAERRSDEGGSLNGKVVRR
jgi:uncharacterized protein YegP (UPF0339 family)